MSLFFAFFASPVNFNGKCLELLFQWYKSAVKHIFRPTFDKFCKSPSFNMISYMVTLFKPLSFFSTWIDFCTAFLTFCRKYIFFAWNVWFCTKSFFLLFMISFFTFSKLHFSLALCIIHKMYKITFTGKLVHMDKHPQSSVTVAVWLQGVIPGDRVQCTVTRKDKKEDNKPSKFFDCLCIFLKNYNTLVSSKICFLYGTFQGT